MEQSIHCSSETAILRVGTDAAGCEPILESRKPPQAGTLTDSEREALQAWATRYGFALLNDRDMELAIPVWWGTRAKKAAI